MRTALRIIVQDTLLNGLVDSACFHVKISTRAEVAELADALRSGRSGRKLVWVRLPPSALQSERTTLALLLSSWQIACT